MNLKLCYSAIIDSKVRSPVMFGAMSHEKRFAIFVLMFFFMGVNNAMASIYLFSEVKGVVLKGGAPIAGAVVEQEYRWAWKDEVGIQSAITDSEGEFGFHAVVKQSFLGSLLPHEPLVRQTILIKHEGSVYKAWMLDKGNYQENGELKGNPIVLYCDLDEPLSHKGDVYGICQLR